MLCFRCPNAFYSFDSQLSHRKTSFGYGNKYDFTQTTTVSPPSTKYKSKSFVDDSKKNGKTFGISRDLSPDRSYLIPQLHKNPGPGKVFISFIYSMTTKRSNKITLVIHLDQELLMFLRNITLKSTLLLLQHIIQLIWNLKTEDFCMLNTLILNLVLWVWKAKDFKRSRSLQDQALMLRKIVWLVMLNIFCQIIKEMEHELSIKLSDLLDKNGQTFKTQHQETIILVQILVFMVTQNTTKL